MDLHKLRCFIKVVEEGSISQAARVLNMTQPPLSILIHKLEKELNVTLFQRHGKRLIITETGKLLYEKGKSLLDKSEELVLELKEKDRGLRGTVRVGCITSANLFLIPDVIRQLMKEAPNVVTRVKEGDSSYILSELRNNNLDIGITRTIFQAEDLNTTPLITEPLLLALPPGHPLIKKSFISLVDLRDEHFILPATSYGHGISDDIIEACHASGFSPKVVYWGTETLPMLQMVSKGVGISFAPGMYRHLKGELPHLVEMSIPKLRTRLILVTMKNRFLSPATKRFMNITEKTAQEITEN
ncbi:MAG: LysR family transcriptional regulator [Bacillaceae bacterium]|nr:LysR family transcriptional regulator [Bacillaceae bacterium]